tara:strand:- start:45978 stop:47567 length:1590 start_codon:yes stop_codon:yes gene_type:complete
MNNYFVLYHLTIFLKKYCLDSTYQFSISPFKDVWTAYVGSDDQKFKLLLSTHPSETALFLEGHKPAKKSNVTSFFDQISGKTILDMNISDHDRFIHIYLEDDFKLLLQLFGNKPNIYLIQKNKIIESFKNPDQNRGKNPPIPRQPTTVNKIMKEGLSAKKTILKFEPKFPRHLIPSVIEHFTLEEKNSTEISAIVGELSEAMIKNPEFRILEDGNLCLIPESLLPVRSKMNFEDVNSAVRHLYFNTSHERRLTSKIQQIKPSLEKRIQALESLIDQLKEADKGLERAEKYEQYGHILMANAHESTEPDSESITLPNYYDDNKPVHIPIKPKLNIAENAQNYYEKSAKAIRSVEESKRRLKDSKSDLSKLYTLQESFSKIEKIYEFSDWHKDHISELHDLGVINKSSKEYSSPYRKLRIDNYEVWVGKNAKSNDRLTSDAHKEDVWMHARGVSGSHLVIRMNNNKEMPPKNILLKAASVAAYHSKARGSDLAPVIITKRKYISKPKGSPPGSVRVEREQVEMVHPLNLTK